MKCIIDAHSWIEYLRGSSAGEKVNEIINGDNEIYVMPITIAEVIGKIEKSGGNTDTAYNAMIKNASILEATPKMSKDAGILYAKIRKENESFGIVDALLISAAKVTESKLISGDKHFKRFKEAIII